MDLIHSTSHELDEPHLCDQGKGYGFQNSRLEEVRWLCQLVFFFDFLSSFVAFCVIQTQWSVQATPAVMSQRLEDCQEFKASLDYKAKHCHQKRLSWKHFFVLWFLFKLTIVNQPKNLIMVVCKETYRSLCELEFSVGFVSSSSCYIHSPETLSKSPLCATPQLNSTPQFITANLVRKIS